MQSVTIIHVDTKMTLNAPIITYIHTYIYLCLSVCVFMNILKYVSEVQSVILDDDKRLVQTVVRTGNSVELKCDIRGSEKIIWKRNGHLLDHLTSTQIQTFTDASLDIMNLNIRHTANYSCQDANDDSILQSHLLFVERKYFFKLYFSKHTIFFFNKQFITKREIKHNLGDNCINEWSWVFDKFSDIA